MSEHDETLTESAVKVAKILSDILDLDARLLTQAVSAGDDAEMPGGAAMVALGNVANMEAWENLHQATERYDKAYTSVADEDPDEAWSAFQLIDFWSGRWRAERDAEYGGKPTIASEVNFVRWSLNWAWDNELYWDDFAADMRRAKAKLENILAAGERAESGAPCLYEGCKGKRLRRKLQPGRDGEGRKVWDWGPWHCPRCHREWTEDAYARMVTAANEAAKVELINGEQWVSTDMAARRVGRPASTIRVWVHRAEVAVVCLLAGRRTGFVRMSDVEERHAKSRRRKRAA